MALNTSDPNAVHQAIKGILSQTQFTSQKQSIWDRIIFYITHPLDFVSLVVSWVLGLFLGNGVSGLLAAILAAVVGAVVIFLIVRYGRTTTRNSAVRVHYAPNESGKSVKQLLAEADALEREEKWRDAIRLRYAAMIQDLGEQGIVRARSGRTTGEYLGEVNRNAPGIADVFGQATRIFEWVWYGDGQAGRDEALEFKILAQSVTQKAAA